jgi:chemotaxis response regulator CheB
MHTPPLILIVDDDADFKEILSAKFLASGYQVAEASDGGEGITKAKSLIPDLIVMDVQMPNVNGTEAVLELKHTQETKDVKIVFFSSLIYPWPGVKSENSSFAQEIGAITFLKKSDELEKIVSTITGLLGGAKPVPVKAAAASTPTPTPTPVPPAAPIAPVTAPAPTPAPQAPATPATAPTADPTIEHAPKIVSYSPTDTTPPPTT